MGGGNLRPNARLALGNDGIGEADDVDAARRHLTAAGVEIGDEPPIPGRPRFTCRDPFGNLIEVTTIRGSYVRE